MPPSLLADDLFHDARIAEARRLVLEAVADHQQRLTGVRPPDAGRAQSYAALIEQFNTLRGGALYYSFLGSGIGCGPLVELADGSVKYDMISGIGVHFWGHSNPLFINAAFDAMLRDTIMQGNLQQNVESADLAQMLVAATGNDAPLRHAFLTTSGAMANENALKLCFRKKTPANRILAFEHTFAGRTFVLSQITDKALYRAGLPDVMAVDYIPFFDPAHPAESTDVAVRTLLQHLTRYPDSHAVMGMEMVLGEGGYYPGDRDFFLALINILHAHGILLWIDEVQTFGRTGSLFAFQHFGLERHVDVVTIGKLTQLCAMLFTDELKPPPGLISQTFTGATASIFAAKAILHDLLKGHYFGPDGKIARIRKLFIDQLQAIAARHPGWIAGPFGIGAMIAFTPFDGSPERVKQLLHALFNNGVIAYAAGDHPARIRFLPPIAALRDEDVQAVCQLLETTLEQIDGSLLNSGERP